MAAECAVFGSAITESAVLSLTASKEEAGDPVSLARRAYYINNTTVNLNARNHVEGLREEWGTGRSTLCTVHNATGGPLHLVLLYDDAGGAKTCGAAGHLGNGQSAVFLHKKTNGTVIVYSGKNAAGYKCDWMVSFTNNDSFPYLGNKVYAEVRGAGHYDDVEVVERVVEDLHKCGSKDSMDSWNECTSYAAITSGSTSIFSATLTLVGMEG